MAYEHGRYEVMLSQLHNTAFNSASTGFNPVTAHPGGIWLPGFVPHLLRGISVVAGSTSPTAGFVQGRHYFEHRKPAWSGSGSATVIWNFRPTVSVVPLVGLSADKRVFYHTITTDVVINPGESVYFNVSAAGVAGGIGRVCLYVEPVWDHPRNATAAHTASGGGLT